MFRDAPVPKRTKCTYNERTMKWKNLAAETCTFFITGTISEWQPLLLQDRPRQIVLQDLDFFRRKYSALILAFVIMPEHYHIVIELRRPEDLHSWLRDFQSHTAHELARYISETLPEGDLRVYRQHANGKAKMAVWKEQARAELILTQPVLDQKINYIHDNPLRRGLVDCPGDWPLSSWRNYELDDQTHFYVDTIG